MSLEPEAEPGGGEAAAAVRLFPCDTCRQLTCLGDCPRPISRAVASASTKRRRESEGSRRPSRRFSPHRLFRGSDPSQIVSPRDSCCKGSQERSRARRYAAASAGRAGWLPPIRSGNVTPTGEAAELGEHDALCEPGPGIWPLRLAKCQRWGEDGRSPGFRTFLPLGRDKFKRPVSPPELRGREYPAANSHQSRLHRGRGADVQPA